MGAPDLDDLVARARALVRPDARGILGITGPPGAGKTTLAVELMTRLRADGVGVAHVPMDGFHLADVTLAARGASARKGAIDTFDRDGYAALLRRLRAEREHEVFAPDFERTLEQPVAAAITIRADDVLVVTEGNYLLDESWAVVRAELDEVWFVDLPDDVRRRRLLARHVEFGKSATDAEAWVATVDEPNARSIVARRNAADLVVELGA